jgi:hypothetical protein
MKAGTKGRKRRKIKQALNSSIWQHDNHSKQKIFTGVLQRKRVRLMTSGRTIERTATMV